MDDNQQYLSALSGENKKDKVRNMFNSIAKRYDFLNHFLSFGVDYYWRRQVLKIIKEINPDRILDIATGTADLAILATKANPKSIEAIDISSAMLEVGKEKVTKKNLDKIISLKQADAENIPFEDKEFDLAMVAFGVRNFENLEKGLSEIYRVLKPEARLIVLEFSQPEKFPMKQLYTFYSSFILPIIGKIISRDSQAYTYLPESVKQFPAYNDFTLVMEDVGFKETYWKSLSNGISCIYVGKKQLTQ